MEPDVEVEDVLVRQFAGRGGGAAWTAKRLATETATAEHSFDRARSADVVAVIAQILRDGPSGEVSTEESGGTVTLRGLVGSGFGGMNPTYLLAVVDRDAGVVRVGAHAKEGLIKQRSAQKAVRRLLEALAPS